MSTTFTEENNMEVEYGSLKTLTVLTFIGSGLGFLSSLWQYFSIEKNLAKMEETVAGPDFNKMPDFVKKMYSPEMIAMTRKIVENKLSITLLAVIASVLCIYGAIEMRKLKMNGYFLYLIGSVLPIISTLIFIGIQALSGFAGIMTLVITVLFIILYTTQRKYLINK